ncbi:unnamed protein product [Rhizoctonia solani]|uniref:Uncharacterized protein n=1 Tax=Rhizoctonia solani TaxID=456999 RepID=A0A8H3DYI7_9AGAM|nr:unnamed protein product [Rhizoctonia solani]
MSTLFARETQLSEKQPLLHNHTIYLQGHTKDHTVAHELLLKSRILGESGRLEEAWEVSDQAARLCRQALADIYLPAILANPGSSHSNRFHRLEDLDSLEKTIEYESRALSLTPDDHPDLPSDDHPDLPSRLPHLERAPTSRVLAAGSGTDVCICVSSKNIGPPTLGVSKSHSSPTRLWREADLRDPDLMKVLSSIGLLLFIAISWGCYTWT